MANQLNHYFVVTAPGFEELCVQELANIGIIATGTTHGGVVFSGGLRELYLANLWLRSASRVLVRLGEVKARDFPTLYRRLLRLPWGRYVKPGTPCEVRAVCHRSRLSHSGRVAETASEAIVKALGSAPVAEGLVQQVFLRFEDDCCSLSIDSSGELLHRRGYRKAKVMAPLRETLAAGCLMMLGYDGSKPLIDAMTGSGTFAIEAALIALRRAPGAARDFSFMRWPRYRQGLWEQLCQEARRQEATELSAPIIGVDSNPKAIAAAQQNAIAAGVESLLELSCRPMQQLKTELSDGLILCNPPYGERLGRTAALQALYSDLGQLFNVSFTAWSAALVCPETELIRAVGGRFETLLRFSNGGIRVSLLKKP